MESRRQKQVAKLVQKELAVIFQNTRDLLEEQHTAMITVTDVRSTPDLSIAYVYLSLYNAKSKNLLLEEINEKTKQIKALLVMRIKNKLRYMPELKFFADESAEYAAKMDEIFKNIEIPTDEELKLREESLKNEYKTLD